VASPIWRMALSWLRCNPTLKIAQLTTEITVAGGQISIWKSLALRRIMEE